MSLAMEAGWLAQMGSIHFVTSIFEQWTLEKWMMSTWKSLFVILILWWMSTGLEAQKVTYVYSDPQGTPLAEADEQGNITKTFDYRPYGVQALGDPPRGPGYTGHVSAAMFGEGCSNASVRAIKRLRSKDDANLF
jgi:hypothetical protein